MTDRLTDEQLREMAADNVGMFADRDRAAVATELLALRPRVVQLEAAQKHPANNALYLTQLRASAIDQSGKDGFTWIAPSHVLNLLNLIDALTQPTESGARSETRVQISDGIALLTEAFNALGNLLFDKPGAQDLTLHDRIGKFLHDRIEVQRPIRAEVMRLMREDFDPTPPNWEGRDWDDNAEDVADRIVALFPAQREQSAASDEETWLSHVDKAYRGDINDPDTVLITHDELLSYLAQARAALRPCVARLEAALREARCFLENELEVREMAGDLPNSEYIDAPSRLISRIDAALAQPAESGAKPGAVGGPSVVSLELPGGHPAEALPLFELEDGLHEKKEAGDGRA